MNTTYLAIAVFAAYWLASAGVERKLDQAIAAATTVGHRIQFWAHLCLLVRAPATLIHEFAHATTALFLGGRMKVRIKVEVADEGIVMGQCYFGLSTKGLRMVLASVAPFFVSLAGLAVVWGGTVKFGGLGVPAEVAQALLSAVLLDAARLSSVDLSLVKESAPRAIKTGLVLALVLGAFFTWVLTR